MSFSICEHENGWQWKSNYIQENSKWNWHVINKKTCFKFPFVHIIDLFCWCSFRGNYTYFVLHKIVIFGVHIFIKIWGRGREKFKTFLWLSGGKTHRTHLTKVVSRNPKCGCHCNTYNGAINCLYLSASLWITYLQSPCQMLRYQLFIKA